MQDEPKDLEGRCPKEKGKAWKHVGIGMKQKKQANGGGIELKHRPAARKKEEEKQEKKM